MVQWACSLRTFLTLWPRPDAGAQTLLALQSLLAAANHRPDALSSYLRNHVIGQWGQNKWPLRSPISTLYQTSDVAPKSLLAGSIYSRQRQRHPLKINM